jgi:hypothetical protein
MGRQIAVAMTDVDELEFLGFLRASADVQLLEYFAPTKSKIFVDQFSPRTEGHWTYNIWNKAFDWKFEYGRVRDDIPENRRPGWFYITNIDSAPVIQYSRHNFDDATGLTYGRVYWSKSVSIKPGDIHYDIQGFATWYDQIVSWIKKNGKQKVKGAYESYFLPKAMLQ